MSQFDVASLGSLKTVQNKVSVPQTVISNGQMITIKEWAQETMAAELADLFLEKCPGAVVEVKAHTIPEELLAQSGGKVMYLANMTGNPAEPESINAQVWTGEKSKKLTWQEIPNPRRTPRMQSFSYDPGQLGSVDRLGVYMSYNLPSFPIDLGVRERRAVPVAVGDWLLNRVNFDEAFRGAVIKSRPPTEFEPDARWDLDDIRIYLKMISAGTAPLGADSDTLATRAKENGKGAKEQAALLQGYVRELKRELLARVFYFVANPGYRLPERAEFMELKTGKSVQQVSEDEAMALLERAEKSVKIQPTA